MSGLQRRGCGNRVRKVSAPQIPPCSLFDVQAASSAATTSAVEHELGGGGFFVVRISAPEDEPFDGGAEFCTDLFYKDLVGFGVSADMFDRVVHDGLQFVVAEFDHGAVDGMYGAAKGEFLFGDA